MGSVQRNDYVNEALAFHLVREECGKVIYVFGSLSQRKSIFVGEKKTALIDPRMDYYVTK